jgi:hypothetical protein
MSANPPIAGSAGDPDGGHLCCNSGILASRPAIVRPAAVKEEEKIDEVTQ